jgi:hypothetical protein
VPTSRLWRRQSSASEISRPRYVTIRACTSARDATGRSTATPGGPGLPAAHR